jgi:hypothetical protein
MRDLARTLMNTPDSYEVCVWSRGDEWLWTLRGEPSPPVGYALVAMDRVDNSDYDGPKNAVEIEDYATEPEGWLGGFEGQPGSPS